MMSDFLMSAENVSLRSADISVLLTTYKNESADNLKEAMASIYEQTLLPKEVVLVVDGPIPDDQEAIIQQYFRRTDIQLNVVRLADNVGRGAAKNIGINQCQCEFIAVMDSDDISVCERFEKQHAIFLQHPEIGLVSGWQSEFDNETKKETFIKKCPETHNEIVRALKWRNVVPNPAVMVRRELAVKVNGYGDFKMINEDYDFFLKLIEVGVKFYNIQEILIHVRTSLVQRKRRGGWMVIKDDFKFRYQHYKNGFYKLPEFLFISTVYLAFRMTPAFSKGMLYRINRSI